MKKFNFALGLISMIFFMVSCSVEHICQLEVVMKNVLPTELKIHVIGVEPLLETSNANTNTITIPSQGEASFTWDYLKQIDYPVYFNDNQCDTIIVVFNDSVQAVFSREDKSRFNPILMENYESLPTHDSWNGCLRYTFTEEDYRNALIQYGYLVPF